jgi:hypothetical protein
MTGLPPSSPTHHRRDAAIISRRLMVGDGGVIGRGRRQKRPGAAPNNSGGERALQGLRGGAVEAAGGRAAGAGGMDVPTVAEELTVVGYFLREIKLSLPRPISPFRSHI